MNPCERGEGFIQMFYNYPAVEESESQTLYPAQPGFGNEAAPHAFQPQFDN